MARFTPGNHCCTMSFLLLFLCGFYSFTNAVDIDLNLRDAPLLDYGSPEGDTLLKDYSSADARRVELPFNVTYFGSSYKTLYVSKDGLLSFDASVRYIPGVIWNEGTMSEFYDKPFMAPFYHHGYEPITSSAEYAGKIYFRLIDTEKLDGDRHESDHKLLLDYMNDYVQTAVVNPPRDFSAKVIVVVTWEDVTDVAQKGSGVNPRCGVDSQPCLSSTFQAVLVADDYNTFVIFNYKKMDIPMADGNNYQAGFNGGFRRGWFNVIPCQEECIERLNATQINALNELTGSDETGRFVLSVGHEVIVRGGCLPEFLEAGTLEVYPREVGMLGGEVLQVSGKCASKSSPVHCRFSYDDGTGNALYVETAGQMRNEMKGFCPVPYMTWKGPTRVSWSSDGQEWSTHRSITVVLPDRMTPDVNIPLDVMMSWYSRDADTITLKWDPAAFSPRGKMAEVEVTLLAYREETERVMWRTLESFGKAQNDAGTFTFPVQPHRCKTNCEDWEMGFLVIQLPQQLWGQATRRTALRYGPIPLGWWVNEELTETKGYDWPQQKCEAWHLEDGLQTSWLQDLPACPCSLDQAISDFGRFQPDTGCNLFTGSVCHFHQGAKHCVRSVQPGPKGAGNQCCYNNQGNLMYAQLSYQGSTPDRSHSWGSHPYGRPDRVPSLSHWKHDVISFYYCCLWVEDALCDRYMERRPTADCKNYDVPGVAFLRGDPHISTFDGQEFNFGGKGDFWLVETPGLKMQGRFDSTFDVVTETSNAHTHGATALTMLALHHEGSPDVLVWPAPKRAQRPRGLDVFVGGERRFFYTASTMWQDFQGGLTIINNAPTDNMNRHDNFTVLVNNVGVVVVNVEGLLQVTVALPPEMKPTNQNAQMAKGLLGAYDGQALNDFTSREGAVTSHGQSREIIYENFAWSWKVSKEESLFKSPMVAQEAFSPYLEYKDIPVITEAGALLDITIRNFCQDNQRCRWDYRITGNRKIARATLEGDKAYAFTQASTYRVDNCGLPAVGPMAVMNSYNFSVGREVKVVGCGVGKYFLQESLYECVREPLDIAEEFERADYGYRREDENDRTIYVIHWLPRPEVLCSDEDPNMADIAIIAGIAIGAFCGLILIAVVGYCIYKKRNSGSARPKPAARGGNAVVRGDSGAADAMLTSVSDRSPVYRPSAEGRGSSGGRGSNGGRGSRGGEDVEYSRVNKGVKSSHV